MKPKSILPILLVISLILCLCLIAVCAVTFYIFNRITQENGLPYDFSTSIPNTPTPFSLTREPISEDEIDTLKVLENTIIPERNLAKLACRFNGVCNAPATVPAPNPPYKIGDKREFWVSNTDTAEYRRMTATLVYMTEHAYLWVEDGVYYEPEDAQKLLGTFEKKIYPTNREFFGSEWTPGIDNDPHIYIIYANNLGWNVAGYFVSLDSYHPAIVEYSNAIESFYIDSSQDLASPYTYSVLAHEFQHMIHWYQDANESSFLDEGFAELAVFLNDYDTGGFDALYARNPDIPLTDWREDDNGVHYGANFLFALYFLDRFGETATQALVRNPENELKSVDETLRALNIRTSSNQIMTADDFFLEWVIANFLMDKTFADGRFYYHNYPNAPQTRPTETISQCPLSPITRTVNQYGVDYIEITCTGDYTLEFRGTTKVSLLPANPHSGKYAFWSNKANESNTSLEKLFDFRKVSGPIEMIYWVWYDLEEDYDYVHLSASTDGQTWKILITPSGTGKNPSGNSYGWGYNGKSGTWLEERVDLSQYAGQQVWVRFDYITDAAVVNEGFLIDDISIPAINYFEDFEQGDGGWQAAGFVRVQNVLPQTFRLAIIRQGDEPAVEAIALSSNQTATIPLSLKFGEKAVLVVTATTRITHQPAGYEVEIR
ncbi:MAG: immune inhibitor A [Anaerolineales bacterium]|nr:immune inhibitor A [Anaerolineales bacterium]